MVRMPYILDYKKYTPKIYIHGSTEILTCDSASLHALNKEFLSYDIHRHNG